MLLRAFNVACSFSLTVLRGLVIAIGWDWFVADTFGIYAISLVQAIGISMVVNLIMPSTVSYHIRDESRKAVMKGEFAKQSEYLDADGELTKRGKTVANFVDNMTWFALIGLSWAMMLIVSLFL